MYPSRISMVFSGIAILLALIYAVAGWMYCTDKYNFYIIASLLFAVAIGVHGLAHGQQEQLYGSEYAMMGGQQNDDDEMLRCKEVDGKVYCK